MQRTLNVIEYFVLVISSIFSILISICDWLGLLTEIPWLSERIPNLILLSNGILIGCFAFVIYRRLTVLDKISSQLETSAILRVKELAEQVDPNLQLVIGNNVEELVSRLYQLITESKFEISDTSLFRSIYKRTLETYTNSTFYATSVPSERFFWKNQSIEQAIGEFIKNKGRMKRIFFINSYDDLEKLEIRRILRIQCDMGVEVYTCIFNEVPGSLHKFFMVDTEGKIAWEPFRGPDNLITGIIITSNGFTTEKYLSTFQQLISLDSTKRFYDAGSWIDPNVSFLLSETQSMNRPTFDPNAFRVFEYDGWEQSADQYDSSFGKLTSQTIDPLLNAAGVSPDMKVLDIASGPGYVASLAAERNCEVIGIDFSDAMVKKARINNPGIEFWRGEAENLPFEEAQFDAAVMNFGILHLAQPEEALRQALRVIRTNAKFAFTVWTKPEESEAFKIVLRAIETNSDQSINLPDGPPFFKYSDPDECKFALKNAGFVKPVTRKIEMVWELEDHHELFNAFYKGTARTGGLLRAQSEQAIKKIQASIKEGVSIYMKNNKLIIPMSAIVASAQKS